MNFDLYRECRLCPRDCGVDRTTGARGVCGEAAACRVSSIGAHFGEEPSFSGTKGSGTIFFSGCSSRCFFCQNYQISTEHLGREMTPEELLRAARKLAASGVHNLNFVTPDHFWPHIAWVCRELRSAGVTIPFLFNSSGYQRADRIERYAEWMDIFMPDFKFAEPELARECRGDARYPEIAVAALRKMVDLKGFLDPWDPTGARPALRGVLVRHLILPDHVENSLEVLRRLKHEFGRFLPLSVMSQFHPVPACRACGKLTRRIHEDEHRRVQEEVLRLEFEHVYLQELSDSREFLPDFSEREPFRGNRRRPR
jgi:putative pyruvate formate lyase activating enzyme